MSGWASRSQCNRFFKRRLMSLILKLAIFIGSASGELSTQTGKNPCRLRARDPLPSVC
jgi:hypothetical protein